MLKLWELNLAADLFLWGADVADGPFFWAWFAVACVAVDLALIRACLPSRVLR